MKTKLQVVETVTETVKFAFVKLPMTIRLGWLGVFLFFLVFIGGVALSFVSTGGIEMIGDLESLDEGDFDPRYIGTIIGVYIGFFFWAIVGMLALVPFIVVMHRIAAGEIEPPRGIAYFRFGGREIKFIVANIVLSVLSGIVFAICLLPGFVALGVGVLSGIPPEAWEALGTNPEMFEQALEENVDGGQAAISGLITALAFIVGIILYIWFAVRACLFTTAAAVEDEFAPFGAFGLTGGNVWRIIGAFLLFFLAIIVLEIILIPLMLIVGGLFGALFIPLFQQGGGAAAAGGALVGLVFLVLYVFLIAFFTALEIGFKGKMYMSLTRDIGTDPDTDEDLVSGLDDEAKPLA